MPEPGATPGEAPTVEVDTTPTSIEERRADELRARPLLVFVHTDPDVCDGTCEGACQRYFHTDENLFTDAKVSLAVRAYRTVWMTPEEAAAEPLLEDTGDVLPRLVLLDVARDARTVAHGKRLKASRFYGQLRKTSDRFYRERLDGVVKKHLKLLDAYDRLAVEESRLQDRLTRTTNLDKIHDLEDELDDLKDEREELDRRVEDLWRLTLREL